MRKKTAFAKNSFWEGDYDLVKNCIWKIMWAQEARGRVGPGSLELGLGGGVQASWGRPALLHPPFQDVL